MNQAIDIFNYKAVFFDLDGTLIDSAKDLSFAIGVMSAELGIEQIDLAHVKKWIGNGTLKLVESALFHATNSMPDEKQLNHAFHIFSKAYRDCVGEYSTLFESTQKLLVKLLSKQIKIACITNKPLEFTEFLLQQNMISQFFSVICAGDNVQHTKPHPWPLLHASEVFGVDISNCLMIGDSQHDIEAAKRAGCDVIAVSYGYNHGEDIKDSLPNQVIDSFNQLV